MALEVSTMRIMSSPSKNAISYYVIKSIRVDGKNTSKIVEKLGTISDIKKRAGNQDPLQWAKQYAKELTKAEKITNQEIIVKYSPNKIIDKNDVRHFNGGYLFIQKIYYELGLHNICKEITSRHNFDFDLNSVLSRLVYGRIIYPSSKLATYKQVADFLEKPKFDLHHTYRALDILAEESDFIQAQLYKNSLKLTKRHTGILYYDCTNYFFEIEQASGIKQYGHSKENRPNPIVQMGLFMDGEGIPLAFDIHPGNTNEQTTLKPLEKKILADFGLSRFVVCTDAGLSCEENRRFNNFKNRAFITTQSIKKLKTHLKQWSLENKGWKLPGSNKEYDISKLDPQTDNNLVFYRERWIKENNFEQRLIVTFSLKYRNYLRTIRGNQIKRAEKAIKSNSAKLNKSNQNDFKRLINQTHTTKDGEMADSTILSIDQQIISNEEIYDGFYAVCTNLEDGAEKIIKVNKRRWEIEECFRILKSEFKARPVYLANDNRIHAHFDICFISLIIFRLLEKRLNSDFTYSEIIDGIRKMSFLKIKGEGYQPIYTRTDFTDRLHDVFGFRTDYQITSLKNMNSLFSFTKK